jgi:hypothetical protein
LDITSAVKIGWARVDITPEHFPVNIAGQFHARVSEGVRDPLQAVALAIESGEDQVVFVSVDTSQITEDLTAAVFERLHVPGLDPLKVILHATHTHEAPMPLLAGWAAFSESEPYEDVGLGCREVAEYLALAGSRIAGVVREAWEGRAPGRLAFGQDYAVVGRNRRWVDDEGKSHMYGLSATTAPKFDHIEGYEDHSLNLLATYDGEGKLTGIVVNIPGPSQEDEQIFEISADFWCETREELHRRLGEDVFVLPQCSAAGDLTSHLIFETAPHARMLKLRGRTHRDEVAVRIADAVERILPWIASTASSQVPLVHTVSTVDLPLNNLSQADADAAAADADAAHARFEAAQARLEKDPSLRQKPRWYMPITAAANQEYWYRGVVHRFQHQATRKSLASRVHVLRLGEIAFATNPFEYFVDFGIGIKVKSPAMQTFIVQLAGPGTYIPSARAAAGGGYGAVAASNPVGPEGGAVLERFTVEKIRELFADSG